jgi:hypothetical protein
MISNSRSLVGKVCKTGLLITMVMSLGLFTTAHAYESDSPEASQMAEKLLDSFGGRAVWKDVKAVTVLAVNHFPGIDKPALFEVTTNLERPGNMIRIINHDMNRLRVFAGDSGWSAKHEGMAPSITPFSAERLVQERFIWDGAFARNLWRIASRDPGMRLRINDRGQLEILNDDNQLAAWLEVDNDGELSRFGFGNDRDGGITLGAYAQYGDFRLPVAGETGGVTFESIYFRPHYEPVDLPRSAPNDFSEYNLASHFK